MSDAAPGKMEKQCQHPVHAGEVSHFVVLNDYENMEVKSYITDVNMVTCPFLQIDCSFIDLFY